LHPCTTPTLICWLFCMFVLLSTHLHVVFYCLVPFISVIVLLLTGTASVGAAHFSCRINPFVCFLEGGFGWVGH
jgi:hypothetical protein